MSKRKTHRRTTLALIMPDKTLMVLSYMSIALFLTYVVFIVVTVYFATMQTGLAANVRQTEVGITALEKQYYDGVSQVSSADPHGAGYVTPTEIHYAQARISSGLTFAGN